MLAVRHGHDMSKTSKTELMDKIQQCLRKVEGKRLTRKRFLEMSGLKLSDVFRHFSKWSDAVAAADPDYEPYHQKIQPDALLRDWGHVARKIGQIPTRNQYKLKGNYSPGVFDANFASWSQVPDAFRVFAQGKSDWQDVVQLLPDVSRKVYKPRATSGSTPAQPSPGKWHTKLDGRPTFGEPIDFRGLRHAPVNEQGVVFLFGMVARELGYMVEAVQTGFPDCEAKRQVARGQWQPVRIEFEFESRNFTTHPGHDPKRCDVIVCWRNNWHDCPDTIEVVELSKVIQGLSKSDE